MQVTDPRETAKDLLAWGVRPADVFRQVKGAVPLSTLKRWAHEVPIAYAHWQHIHTPEERLTSAITMVEKGVAKVDAHKKTGCDWDSLANATRHIDGAQKRVA